MEEDDLVLLVMPQDIQAPKGRLILPQVQTIRELLDKKCLVMSVTTDKFLTVLPLLARAPKLIITDSQVFGYVYENKPKDARIICINDAGKELFYVFKYDNGPDYIQEGLFRIMDEDGLVGFADSLGNVIIEPQFKFAYPFKGGKTSAQGKR